MNFLESMPLCVIGSIYFVAEDIRDSFTGYLVRNCAQRMKVQT